MTAASSKPFIAGTGNALGGLWIEGIRPRRNFLALTSGIDHVDLAADSISAKPGRREKS
jgi:hypothetical protein